MAAKVWLSFASLFFYTYWNVKYLPLLLVSIFFNYAIGTVLVKYRLGSTRKKSILIFGIVCNLLLLGYYKYFNFFLENLNYVLPVKLIFLKLVLPLGISFFTFTQIAFLVDNYKGSVKEHKFLNYLLFVTFFPHLIAGPIIHHREMMPQFDLLRHKLLNYKNLTRGLFLFSLGLFKKVVIADMLSAHSVRGFDQAKSLNFVEAWVTSLSYTFQLYFDFSGYTDMALGLSLMFNIRLPENFNSPYKALSIQDFWRRWHMTLSRFLRDYVYIPLGGSRNGQLLTFSNLLVTFFICGLWHGAGWTFIFWGLLNGLAIVVNKLWEHTGIKMNIVLAWLLTLNFINISWVFFRAKSWAGAIKVLSGMFGLSEIGRLLGGDANVILTKTLGIQLIKQAIASHAYIIISLCSLFLLTVFFRNSDQLTKEFAPKWQVALFSSLLFAISILSINKVSEFLYFNF